jgi:hypothetical protein
MLNWLSSKLGKARGEQHPLGSPSAIKRFLEQLHGQDPAEILGEIGSWLGDDGRLAVELSPADSRRAIRALDEFAQEAVSALWAKLFASAEEEVAEAPRVALATYFGHAVVAYRMAIAHFPPGPAINPHERGELCLFIGRALRLLADRNRLNRFRYRIAGADHWSAAHEFYRTARERNALTVNISLYDPADKATTVEAEYLHGLMFDVAPLDNMAPRQMEVVERYLRQSATQLTIGDSASVSAPFVVDFQSGSPPRHWHPGLAAPSEGFFFGPGDAWPGLLAVLNLLQQETAPGWLASIPLNRQVQAEALLLLRQHWSPQPPQRQAPRSPEDGALLLVHGFGQVRRMVALSAYVRSGRKLSTTSAYTERARIQQDYFGTVADTALLVGKNALDPADNLTPIEMIAKLEASTGSDAIDRWALADSSATGIGAVVPMHRSWLHVGTLVGYRRENAVYWQVAVVRRLGRSPDGKRLAGLQLLAGIPQPVHVKSVGSASAANVKIDGNSLADFDDAILLSTDAGTLLLEPSHVVGDLLVIAGEKIRLVVKLAERIDGTGEFKLFRYEPA